MREMPALPTVMVDDAPGEFEDPVDTIEGADLVAILVIQGLGGDPGAQLGIECEGGVPIPLAGCPAARQKPLVGNEQQFVQLVLAQPLPPAYGLFRLLSGCYWLCFGHD